MICSPFSDFSAALLADADLLVTRDLVSDAGTLAALRAYKLDFAYIDGGLHFDDAAIFALQILAAGDEAYLARMKAFKAELAGKIAKANEDLKAVTFKFKTN